MGGNLEPDLDIYICDASSTSKQEILSKKLDIGKGPFWRYKFESLSVIIKLIFNLIGSQRNPDIWSNIESVCFCMRLTCELTV